MLSLILLVMGIVMIVIPKQCTKKDKQDDPAAVKKVRISGIVMVCCAVVLELIAYFALGTF